MFLSHEITCYLQCRTQIFKSYRFLAEQVMLELQCIESLTSLELLRTLILCFPSEGNSTLRPLEGAMGTPSA